MRKLASESFWQSRKHNILHQWHPATISATLNALSVHVLPTRSAGMWDIFPLLHISGASLGTSVCTRTGYMSCMYAKCCSRELLPGAVMESTEAQAGQYLS